MASCFRFLIVLLGLAFTSCATMNVADFKGRRPNFDPTQFFTGSTVSNGVIESREGRPKEVVTTRTSGRWQGDALRLEQDLVFSVSKPQHRSWRIRKLDAHHYEATANDVVGTVKGIAYGNVFHWRFALNLSPGNPLVRVRLSQWMYLQPDGKTMVNHSTITKFGIVVAQVTEQFRKQ